MYVQRQTSIWIGLLAAATVAAYTPKAAAGVVLITVEQAQLPAPKEIVSSRAITRGPRIQVSGIDDAKLHSPLHFTVRFLAFGGSTIDLSTLVVTYLRGPNIDLTRRIRAFVQPAGIDIPDAEVPPGEHTIRVELKDSEGRRAMTNFVLTVAPD
jgi:hypothetical protein